MPKAKRHDFSGTKKVMPQPEKHPKSPLYHTKSKKSIKNHQIALVCDWLTTPGGAEKVLLELHRMYPDAPIYTSQYRKKGIDWFNDAEVHTGWLNFFPAWLRRFLGPLRQLYFSHLDLSQYDLVISVTGAEAKSIRTENQQTGQKAYHLCYCHVPTQYYWQMYDHYIKHPGFGILNPLVRLALKILVKPLRKADFRAAQRPDQFVTISTYAAEQIKKYYHREAKVIYPPVDVEKFKTKEKTQRRGFVIACRQATWKRVDLAISACIAAKVPLKVIGDGPEHARLVNQSIKVARDSAKQNNNLPLTGGKLTVEVTTVQFIPWLDQAKLAKELRKAEAFLFPSLEPFGIAAVEALAAGCPVIAYADGGSRDIVQPGKNGLLFDEQSTSSLASALKQFDGQSFSERAVQESAQKFATQNFRREIAALIKKALKERGSH